MNVLRVIAKILLLPVSLVLSLLVSIGRFLTSFSAVLLCIIAGVFFLVGIGSMVLLREPFSKIWTAFLLSWLFSPYGLPYFARFLVELMDAANDALKSI